MLKFWYIELFYYLTGSKEVAGVQDVPLSQQCSSYLLATVDYLSASIVPLPCGLYRHIKTPLFAIWHAGGYLPPTSGLIPWGFWVLGPMGLLVSSAAVACLLQQTTCLSQWSQLPCNFHLPFLWHAGGCLPP